MKRFLLTSAVILLGGASASARPHLFARRQCQPCQQQAVPVQPAYTPAVSYQPAPVQYQPQTTYTPAPAVRHYQPGPVVQAVGNVVQAVAQVPVGIVQQVGNCVGGRCPVPR